MLVFQTMYYRIVIVIIIVRAETYVEPNLPLMISLQKKTKYEYIFYILATSLLDNNISPVSF